MVVAHVVLTLDAGGQEYLVVQLAERLQRRGIQSPVIALAGGTLIEDARALGIRTFDMRKPHGLDLSLFFKLAGLFRRERVDVVHTHNFAPLIYGTVAARVQGIPAMNTRHGRAALSTHPAIWALTNRVVAVSEDARRQMEKHNRIAERKVSVILNGVDLAGYNAPAGSRAAMRARLGIEEDATVFGTVARLAPEKDQQMLLEAFRIASDRGCRARLLIVGGGPLQEPLEAQARQAGIADRVLFLGFRKDIPDLLRCMDVFVLPSKMEGISLTLLEAMAASLPIIATRVGGNPEVVVDGETGLLVSSGDAHALAEAMCSLHRDPQKAVQLGARGRERAVHVFDIDQMVDSYLAIYRELAGN